MASYDGQPFGLPLVDPQLAKLFHMLRSSAAFLVGAGLLVVCVPLRVRDFRPNPARFWRDRLGRTGMATLNLGSMQPLILRQGAAA